MPAPASADALGHAGHVDDGVALVAGFDLDIDVGAEHAVVARIPPSARRRSPGCSTA